MEEITKETDRKNCYYFIIDLSEVIYGNEDTIKRPKIKKGQMSFYNNDFGEKRIRLYSSNKSHTSVFYDCCKNKKVFEEKKHGCFIDVDKDWDEYRRVYIIITENEEKAKKYYRQTIKDFAKKLTKKLLED